MRLPGIAPGLPPWRGGILAVKSQPRKLKGPEANSRSRPMLFQQRTNTSWRSLRSQPAVSRRLFRCLRAHLLRSPWTVKFVSLFLAVRLNPRRHTTSVTSPSSFSPSYVSRQKTSFRCPIISTHRFDPFVTRSRTNKKPCYHHGKQGFGNYFGSSFTCLPPVYPIWVLVLDRIWIGQG